MASLSLMARYVDNTLLMADSEGKLKSLSDNVVKKNKKKN